MIVDGVTVRHIECGEAEQGFHHEAGAFVCDAGGGFATLAPDVFCPICEDSMFVFAGRGEMGRVAIGCDGKTPCSGAIEVVIPTTEYLIYGCESCKVGYTRPR